MRARYQVASVLAKRFGRRKRRAVGGRSADGSAYAKTRNGTDDPSFAARVLSAASVAVATLLGKRTATRGRIVMEG